MDMMRIETTTRFGSLPQKLFALTRDFFLPNKDTDLLSSSEIRNKRIINLCNQTYKINDTLRKIIHPKNTTEREGSATVIINDLPHYCVYSAHVYPEKGFTLEIIHGEPAENQTPLYAGIAKIIGIYRVGLRRDKEGDKIIFNITTEDGEENLYIASSKKQKLRGIEVAISELVFPQESESNICSADKHGMTIIKMVNAVISDESVKNNIKQ